MEVHRVMRLIKMFHFPVYNPDFGNESLIEDSYAKENHTLERDIRDIKNTSII
ncbi:hypothetical protein YC2023_012178 [Brassica napus]